MPQEILRFCRHCPALFDLSFYKSADIMQGVCLRRVCMKSNRRKLHIASLRNVLTFCESAADTTVLPRSFYVRCFTLPCLFAGKMHALLFRAWKNRVKGRDWYDFEWYVRHNVPLDFAHLAERCKQFNNEDITPELFKEKLKERLSTADIKQVKEDLLPFVRNPKELDIWSNDYFVLLADMVRIE